MTIAEVNGIATRGEFAERLGWVFEHSPWVAERTWESRPFVSPDDLCEKMAGHLGAAPRELQLALLRAHPDLGTRAKVSPDSAREQAGAGLDRLTEEEYLRLLALNAAYKEKFGFPFLYAVKGGGKEAILEALALRLGSAPEEEFEEAMRQVRRIARFRLEGFLT